MAKLRKDVYVCGTYCNEKMKFIAFINSQVAAVAGAAFFGHTDCIYWVGAEPRMSMLGR